MCLDCLGSNDESHLCITCYDEQQVLYGDVK